MKKNPKTIWKQTLIKMNFVSQKTIILSIESSKIILLISIKITRKINNSEYLQENLSF